MPKLTAADYRRRNEGKATLNLTHSELTKQWHPTKNGDLKPSDCIANDYVKVWWKCSKCGNEWNESVHKRAIDGRGCAGCAGQKTIPGFNDVLTTNPELLKDWDVEENLKENIRPCCISRSSHKKVHWKCEIGHQWVADLNNRSKGQGCPYCMRTKVLKGFNDLATTHPNIAKEWHKTKNGRLKPTDVLAGSGKKIWWHCPKCKQDYEASCTKRTALIKPTGCPVCSGKKVVVGYNDLTTTHPHIAAEWHPTKNGSRLPSSIVAGSFDKVWWLCSNGHEWVANPAHRCPDKYGTGCPICAKHARSSYPEQKMFYYLHKTFEDAESCFRPRWMRYKELDVYIESLRVAIEYDGEYFHSDKVGKDTIKSGYCKEHGVKLIRIREKGCPPIDDGSVQFFVDPHNEETLNQAIVNVLSLLLNKPVQLDFNEFGRREWQVVKARYINK